MQFQLLYRKHIKLIHLFYNLAQSLWCIYDEYQIYMFPCLQNIPTRSKYMNLVYCIHVCAISYVHITWPIHFDNSKSSRSDFAQQTCYFRLQMLRKQTLPFRRGSWHFESTYASSEVATTQRSMVKLFVRNVHVYSKIRTLMDYDQTVVFSSIDVK